MNRKCGSHLSYFFSAGTLLEQTVTNLTGASGFSRANRLKVDTTALDGPHQLWYTSHTAQAQRQWRQIRLPGSLGVSYKCLHPCRIKAIAMPPGAGGLTLERPRGSLQHLPLVLLFVDVYSKSHLSLQE
jgi:hypothetical protein